MSGKVNRWFDNAYFADSLQNRSQYMPWQNHIMRFMSYWFTVHCMQVLSDIFQHILFHDEVFTRMSPTNCATMRNAICSTHCGPRCDLKLKVLELNSAKLSKLRRSVEGLLRKRILWKRRFVQKVDHQGANSQNFLSYFLSFLKDLRKFAIQECLRKTYEIA